MPVTSSQSSIMTEADGSEDVNDFLKRIRELGDQRDREDEERTRKLEQEILQGRKQREARRAGLHPTSSTAQFPRELIEFQSAPGPCLPQSPMRAHPTPPTPLCRIQASHPATYRNYLHKVNNAFAAVPNHRKICHISKTLDQSQRIHSHIGIHQWPHIAPQALRWLQRGLTQCRGSSVLRHEGQLRQGLDRCRWQLRKTPPHDLLERALSRCLVITRPYQGTRSCDRWARKILPISNKPRSGAMGRQLSGGIRQTLPLKVLLLPKR